MYGVDLLNPPDEIKEGRFGALAPETGKDLWESWTQAEWSELGMQFGATEVLCYPDWSLQLPELARHEGLAFYALP